MNLKKKSETINLVVSGELNRDTENSTNSPSPLLWEKGTPQKGQYFTQNGLLMYWPVTEDKAHIIGRPVEIIEIRNNIDTGEQQLRLAFLKKDSSVGEVYISREELEPEKFKRHLKIGMDIIGKKTLQIINYIDHLEEAAPVNNVHTRTGWGQLKGNLIFKHSLVIGCKSVYQGALNILPIGSLEGWKEIIRLHVLGNTPLELAVVVGLSAPMVAMLRQKTMIDVLHLHQYGNSTEGKTTATRLAVSTAGYPHTKDNGLIKTFAGTPNAMIGNLRDNFGIPIAFDESSIQNGTDFTKFIYTVVNGRDKDRMNANGELRETAEYSTTVITNGEHSLLAKSNQNTGLKMRVLEFGNVKWTKSAEHADKLTEGLLHNYGHAILIFVESLMKLGIATVEKVWQAWCKKCYDAMSVKDNFSQRIANKLALVMASADIAKAALGLEFNLDAILTMLLDAEYESLEARDIGMNAYEYLLEHCFQNIKAFVTEGLDVDADKERFEQLGVIVKTPANGNELLMTPSSLKTILSKGGYQDERIILKSWREKGLLDHDAQKFTRKRKLNSKIGELRVHVIKISRERLYGKNLSSRDKARLESLKREKFEEFDGLFD